MRIKKALKAKREIRRIAIRISLYYLLRIL